MISKIFIGEPGLAASELLEDLWAEVDEVLTKYERREPEDQVNN